MRLYPKENPIPRHILQATSDKKPPPRAPDAYIRQVFDRFAGTFDAELQDLGYRGPQILETALSNELKHGEPVRHVLDAGCGTGLCGTILRPYARKLVGIDLSTAMLDRARRLNIYDEIVTAELTGYLVTAPRSFDLIVAVDTLNYFGDLGPVLEAMADSLDLAGSIFFTCEEAQECSLQRGYHLNPHGRYSHTTEFLDNCLASSGLETRWMASAVLRQEAGRSVKGLAVWARKGGRN